MVLITYTRRFSDTLTTLSAQLNEFSVRDELPGLETFAQQTEYTLSNSADAVGRGRLPQALPPLNATLDAIHTHLKELYALRVAEVTADRGNTPTRKAVLDNKNVIKCNRGVSAITAKSGSRHLHKVSPALLAYF